MTAVQVKLLCIDSKLAEHYVWTEQGGTNQGGTDQGGMDTIILEKNI